MEVAFDSINCTELCDLAGGDWCNTFLNGVKFAKCPNKECVDDLCREAQKCEVRFSEIESPDFCPQVFDGWVCVNRTRAGTDATFSCPAFTHLNFHTSNLAHRTCSSNGTWWDEEMKRDWTNYEGCLDLWAFKWADSITKVYLAGYSISLTFLVFATFTFSYFRALKCVRNTIHMNLFLASMLNNVAWIMWYVGVVYRFETISTWSDAETMVCKLVHVATHYFMVTTYFWMLCEGLYLFVVLCVTFISEQRVAHGLYCLGWGLPAILVPIYVLFRGFHGDASENQFCWMDDGVYNWIYKVPCIISVLVNLVFLAIIVRVLVSKLHTDVSERAMLVKTARAIGVLIPLFGLHNILAAFKPEGSHTVRLLIEYASALSISFQGTVVAILFCFMNSEVLTQLKKFYREQLRHSGRLQSIAMTQYTVVGPNHHQAGEESSRQQPRKSGSNQGELV